MAKYNDDLHFFTTKEPYTKAKDYISVKKEKTEKIDSCLRNSGLVNYNIDVEPTGNILITIRTEVLQKIKTFKQYLDAINNLRNVFEEYSVDYNTTLRRAYGDSCLHSFYLTKY